MLQTVSITDGHLAYRGQGSGRPVVLLHGGALDHRMWDPQVEALSRRYRVIAPDARGHGRSSTPTAPCRHTDDLVAFLRNLGIPRATLVGLSMGAGTSDSDDHVRMATEVADSVLHGTTHTIDGIGHYRAGC